MEQVEKGKKAREYIETGVPGFDDLFKERELNNKVIRHGLTVSFVFLVHFVSCSWSFCIECNSEIIRVFLIHQFFKRHDKSIDGIGGKSIGIRQETNGIVGTVEQRASVDED